MVKYQGQVEITKTGWRVEWISPVNEGQFNRRKRRRYKKSIRLMSEAQLYAVIEGAAQKFARQTASIMERIFHSILVTENP